MQDKMNNVPTDNIPADAMPPDDAPKKRIAWGKIGLFIVLIALLILIGSVVVGTLQLTKMNLGLAKSVASLEQQNQTLQTNLQQIQIDVAQLRTEASQYQSRLTEQQGADVDRWYAMQAQYLVRLAEDHLHYTHNISLALALLTRAKETLPVDKNPNFIALNSDINAAIVTLQKTSQVNVNELYLNLMNLDKTIDQLPVPNYSTMNADNKPVTSTQNATWWQIGWRHTIDVLSRVVIVRNTGDRATPFVMPEQKAFFYQNLHAQLLTAAFAVLHRDQVVYQTSLSHMQTWVKQYCDQDTQATKTMLQTLDALLQKNIAAPTVDLSAILQQFNDYFSQTQTNHT